MTVFSVTASAATTSAMGFRALKKALPVSILPLV